MNKKRSIAGLILFAIPVSFLCFYATNLILSDVANMFYMTLTRDVISSLPLFMLAVEATAGEMVLFSALKYPERKKHTLCRYAFALILLSMIGAGSAVYSALCIYGSFAAPYPFRGATACSLIMHLIVIVFALLLFMKNRGGEKERVGFFRRLLRALRFIFMSVFVYFAFDRFGAVLWMPVYVQKATLYKTALFYLSLLLPVLLLWHHVRFRMHRYKDPKTAGVVFPLVFLAADAALCAAVVVGNVTDPQFVSAISPALGIERLLSMPVVTIAHFAVVTLPIIISMIASIIKTVRHNRKKKRLANGGNT